MFGYFVGLARKGLRYGFRLHAIITINLLEYAEVLILFWFKIQSNDLIIEFFNLSKHPRVMFKTRSNIYDRVIFAKIVNGLSLTHKRRKYVQFEKFTIYNKNFVIDVWLGLNFCGHVLCKLVAGSHFLLARLLSKSFFFSLLSYQTSYPDC